MRFSLLMIAMLTFAGCANVVSSGRAICEIDLPTLTEQELSQLSDQSLSELATYFDRVGTACHGVQ